jgi:hypothetical protein
MTVILTKQDFAWINNVERRVFHYDVRGYPAGEGAGIAQYPHRGWSIIRWNAKAQTDWMEDFATADEALAVLQTRFEEGDSSFISSRKLEGSMDIVWINFEKPGEVPTFALHLLPYEGYKNGGQRRKQVVGEEALTGYLQQLGFPLLRIYGILQQVRTNHSVDLPNVMMNEYEYAVTYRT